MEGIDALRALFGISAQAAPMQNPYGLRGTITPPMAVLPPQRPQGQLGGLMDYASTSYDQLMRGANEVYDAYRNRDVPAALNMVGAAAEPFTGAKRPIGMGVSLAKWLAGYGQKQ